MASIFSYSYKKFYIQPGHIELLTTSRTSKWTVSIAEGKFADGCGPRIGVGDWDGPGDGNIYPGSPAISTSNSLHEGIDRSKSTASQDSHEKKCKLENRVMFLKKFHNPKCLPTTRRAIIQTEIKGFRWRHCVYIARFQIFKCRFKGLHTS